MNNKGKESDALTPRVGGVGCIWRRREEDDHFSLFEKPRSACPASADCSRWAGLKGLLMKAIFQCVGGFLPSLPFLTHSSSPTLPCCPQPTSFSLVCLVCHLHLLNCVFWRFGYLSLWCWGFWWSEHLWLHGAELGQMLWDEDSLTIVTFNVASWWAVSAALIALGVSGFPSAPLL